MAGTPTGGRLRAGSVHTLAHGRPHAGWMMDKPKDSLLPSPANMSPPRTLFSAASSTLGQLAAKPVHSPQPPSASTLRFVGLCALWYLTSALSSNTGKSIMIQFRYPVTLTFVQFAFVSGYCLVLMHPRFGLSTLRAPTRAILRSTLPMAAFQVGGHIFSSMAISRVPVSTVHTIKVRPCALCSTGAYPRFRRSLPCSP
jgi:hypothetical protein